MSLVSLAAEKKLPLYQYMDMDTLDWIAANSPFNKSIGNIFPSFLKDDVALLFKFKPLFSWFLVPTLVNTIHGVRHSLRVGLYSILLARENKNLSPNLQNLLTAAVLHDIRREHDKEDEGHGERAAEWFSKNLEEVSNRLGVNFSKKDKDEIYYAIFYHDLPYEGFDKSEDYLKHKEISNFLKTADALDRYRLPKIKWWFNQEMVRVKPSEELLSLVFYFTLNSEKQYLNCLDNYDSIFKLT